MTLSNADTEGVFEHYVAGADGTPTNYKISQTPIVGEVSGAVAWGP